ncbi:MAG: LysR family transcriptional regulator [Rhodoferax sp.]
MTDNATPETATTLHRLVGKLRFRHLKLLVILRSSGSLHAAAAQLNQTQSALSKSLGEIESAFGSPLFTRSPRGLAPTARGQIAIDGAALLLRELEHVGGEVMNEPATSVLRIGAPPFVAHGYLPKVMASLLRHTPSLRLQLLEERAPVLFDSLLAGKLDALLTIYPPDLFQVKGESLKVEKLFDAQFVVIAGHDHPLTRRRSVSWERLGEVSWVVPSQGSMLRRVVEESFHRAGLRAPTPRIESTSPTTNLQLVAAGLGVGVVPLQTLLASEAKGLVKPIRVMPGLTSVPVALITREGIDNHRVKLLREALSRSHPQVD